jgi:hypothetical protein
MWDTQGTPWIAMSAAWPWTSPHEVWLAIGYERWRYHLRSDVVTFAPGLLPLINPLMLDQATVRTGFDQLIGRGHAVSGALGAGLWRQPPPEALTRLRTRPPGARAGGDASG